MRAELTGDPKTVEDRVEDTRRRCAAGDPAHALVPGRDLHWISAGDPIRERYARELLVLAYQALDRYSLSGMAEAHYRHRHQPNVDVLETAHRL